MEASSLFEDLVYSIEIAGHDAGLQHYGARMLLDTASLRREYREWFVPEDWSEPFLARAEASFELDALTEARTQISPEDLAEAFGVTLPPDYEASPPPVMIEVLFNFTLDLGNWMADGGDADRWHTYLAGISARERLESGLRNLRGEVRRALQAGTGDADWDPGLTASVGTFMAPVFGLLARTLHIEWAVPVNIELDDEEFAAELKSVMELVRAGIEATRAFQAEIQRDFEGVP